MRQPGDRRGEGLSDRRITVRSRTRFQFAQQAQDACSALRRIVDLDMEVGDPSDPQASAKLVPHERHRPAKGRDRRITLGGLTDDAHPDLGMPQVGRGLDRGDRGKPDTRVSDVPGHDRPDLLPEQLVNPLGSLAHLSQKPPAKPSGT